MRRSIFEREHIHTSEEIESNRNFEILGFLGVNIYLGWIMSNYGIDFQKNIFIHIFMDFLERK